MSFLAELQRRKVFKVGAAYLVVAWLAAQAAGLVFPTFGAPDWALRVFMFVLLLGFPIALVMAWVLQVTPDGVRVETATRGSRRIYFAAALLGALAVAWYLFGQRELRPDGDGDGRSIAVLPFVNMSGGAENEYFSDGLSEEILNSLVTLNDLRVVGRTSSFAFKGKDTDLREIGEVLGVSHLLEGSVRRSGDRIRVTAQLIRARDGFHLWSQTYDRDVADTLAVQLDVATNVAQSLNVLLDDAARKRMELAGIQSVEAFIAYQKGMEHYHAAHALGIDLQELDQGYVELSRAIAAAPGFSAAWFQRTDVLIHRIIASEDPAEVADLYARLRADLNKAASLSTDEAQRNLINIDSTLVSNDWRDLPRRAEAALDMQVCRQPLWFSVVTDFLDPKRVDAFWVRQLACDPLNRYLRVHHDVAALKVGDMQRVLNSQAALRDRGQSWNAQEEVKALLLLGRLDEAAAVAERRTAAGDDRMALMVAAFLGDTAGVAAARARLLTAADSQDDPRLEILAHTLAGDQQAANVVAARLDAKPIGPMFLADLSLYCQCGAPFDIAHTPNLRARLAEARLPWPPADVLHYVTKDW